MSGSKEVQQFEMIVKGRSDIQVVDYRRTWCPDCKQITLHRIVHIGSTELVICEVHWPK